MYVGDILEGTTQKTGSPEILKEKPGTALVDAKNVLGPVSSFSRDYIYPSIVFMHVQDL